MQTKILKLLFIFTISILFNSCASEEKNANTPEGLFKIAKEYDDAERFEVAVQKYTEVKNKFPYSSFATLAELAIADTHYKRESYPEAQISYQNFRDLHPKHPKIDYVIYKTGMSYFEQLPDTIDRDLTLANDAIYSFNEIIKSYPKSEYSKEAKEKREKAFIMLAEKEIYIADFYYKQKNYESALTRYLSAYTKYPGFGLDPKALLGTVKSANKLNDVKKVKQYTQILVTQFKQSDEAQLVKLIDSDKDKE